MTYHGGHYDNQNDTNIYFLASGQIRYEPEDYPGFKPSKSKRRRGDFPGPPGQHSSKRGRRQLVRTQQSPTSSQLSLDELDDDGTSLAKGKGKSKAADKDMGTEALKPSQDSGSLAVEAMDTTMQTTDTTVEAIGAAVETMDIAMADTDPELPDCPDDVDWLESFMLSPGP
ncbi:MAG: hypothetical protein M1839_003659 [Geoglossum umbratile]|nr:MAG: hypothetical protein M1839_003659 [Geoglossum umbratile]